MHKSPKSLILYAQYVLLFVAITACYPLLVNADVGEIIQRGKLVVGLPKDKQKPFFYNNKNGALVGIDINLAHLIAHELGVEVEFSQTRDTWNAVVQDVADGKTDIAISYISVTPERSMKVAFSKPYAVVRPVFIMSRRYLANAQEENLETLNQIFNNPKFPFLTQHGTAYTELAKRLLHTTTTINTIDPARGTQDALDKILSNEMAVYFNDEMDTVTYFLEKPEYKLHLINYPFKGYQDNIGIPVAYGSPKLLSLINSILETTRMLYTIEDLIPLLNKEFEVPR